MTIKSNDQTEAADEINYLIDSKAGTVSASTQKLLTDDTTGQSAEAGDAVDLALTDDEQAQLLSASDAALTAILAARVSAAGSSDSSSGSEATDASADSAADATAESNAESNAANTSDAVAAPAQS